VRVTRVRARAIDDAPPRLCVARRRRSCVVVRASARHPSSSARPVSRRRRERTSERPNVTHENIFARDRPIDRSIDRFARFARVGARRATLGRPARCIPPRRARRRRARRRRARRHTSITPTIPRASIAPHITSHHTPSPPSCVSSALCCVSTSAAPTIAIPAKISADRARSIAPFQTRTTRTRTPRGRSDDRWRLNTRRRAQGQGQGLSANRDQGRARPHTPDARETPRDRSRDRCARSMTWHIHRRANSIDDR